MACHDDDDSVDDENDSDGDSDDAIANTIANMNTEMQKYKQIVLPSSQTLGQVEIIRQYFLALPFL